MPRPEGSPIVVDSRYADLRESQAISVLAATVGPFAICGVERAARIRTNRRRRPAPPPGASCVACLRFS